MVRKAIRTTAAIFSAATLVLVVVPGCVIKIGKGNGPGPDETAGSGGSGAASSSGSTAGSGGNDLQGGEDTYARLDPLELRTASAKAGYMTCALSGAVDTGAQLQGLDPVSLDMDAILALVEQYAPDASAQADTWLQSVDTSTLAYTVIPKPECMDQGCEYQTTCQQGYIPNVKHACFVDDCGPAKCRTCPDWVNDILQNIAFKTWCSYVCVQTATSPPVVVAVGAGFISTPFKIFVGPVCATYP